MSGWCTSTWSSRSATRQHAGQCSTISSSQRAVRGGQSTLTVRLGGNCRRSKWLMSIGCLRCGRLRCAREISEQEAEKLKTATTLKQMPDDAIQWISHYDGRPHAAGQKHVECRQRRRAGWPHGLTQVIDRLASLACCRLFAHGIPRTRQTQFMCQVVSAGRSTAEPDRQLSPT
jgi:hypothetical protein